MPLRNRHTIGKQVMLLQLPPSENTFELQQQMSQLYWEKIAPALETLFDRYAGADKQITLDRLDVDLGVVGQKNWKEEFPKRLVACVEEALNSSLINNLPGEIIRQPLRTGHFQQWLHFLEHGYLPWNGGEPESEEAMQKSALDTLASETPALEQLHNLLSKRGLAFDRLLHQHPEVFLKTLTAIFTAQKQDELLVFRSELASLAQQDIKKYFAGGVLPVLFGEIMGRKAAGLAYFFWKKILESAILRREKQSWQALAATVLEALAPEKGQSVFLHSLHLLVEGQKQAGMSFPVLENTLAACFRKMEAVKEGVSGRPDSSAHGDLEEIFISKNEEYKGSEQTVADSPGTSGDAAEGQVFPEKTAVEGSGKDLPTAVSMAQKEGVSGRPDSAAHEDLEEIFISKKGEGKGSEQTVADSPGTSGDAAEEQVKFEKMEVEGGGKDLPTAVSMAQKEGISGRPDSAGHEDLEEIFISKKVEGKGSGQTVADSPNNSGDAAEGQVFSEKMEVEGSGKDLTVTDSTSRGEGVSGGPDSAAHKDLEERFISKKEEYKGSGQTVADRPGTSGEVAEGQVKFEKMEVEGGGKDLPTADLTSQEEGVSDGPDSTAHKDLEEIFISKKGEGKGSGQRVADSPNNSGDAFDQSVSSKKMTAEGGGKDLPTAVSMAQKEGVSGRPDSAAHEDLEEVFVPQKAEGKVSEQTVADSPGTSGDAAEGQVKFEKMAVVSGGKDLTTAVSSGQEEGVSGRPDSSGHGDLEEIFISKKEEGKGSEQTVADSTSTSGNTTEGQVFSEKMAVEDGGKDLPTPISSGQEEGVSGRPDSAGHGDLEEVFVPQKAEGKVSEQTVADSPGTSGDAAEGQVKFEKMAVVSGGKDLTTAVSSGQEEGVSGRPDRAGHEDLEEIFVPKKEDGQPERPTAIFSEHADDAPAMPPSFEKMAAEQGGKEPLMPAEINNQEGVGEEPAGEVMEHKQELPTPTSTEKGQALMENFGAKNHQDFVSEPTLSDQNGPPLSKPQSEVDPDPLEKETMQPIGQRGPQEQETREDAPSFLTENKLEGQSEGLKKGEEPKHETTLSDKAPSFFDEEKDKPTPHTGTERKGFSPPVTDESKPEKTQTSLSETVRPTSEPAAKNDGPAQNKSAPIPSPSEKPAPARAFPEIKEGTAFFVRYAGMVLLHPFLSPFFTGLGLVEGANFKDEEQRHRAVHLLHYLVTKEMGLPEFALLLPKLLCGLPFEEPMERYIELTLDEMDESENLLRAVIKHWGALGSSSPDALREGFLRRDGKLELKESGWQLTIEHKTLDILLNRLPWGIGVIKLPWMEGMLRVDWG